MVFIEVNTTNGFVLKLNPKQISLYAERVDGNGTYLVISGQEFTLTQTVAEFEALLEPYLTANNGGL